MAKDKSETENEVYLVCLREVKFPENATRFLLKIHGGFTKEELQKPPPKPLNQEETVLSPVNKMLTCLSTASLTQTHCVHKRLRHTNIAECL